MKVSAILCLVDVAAIYWKACGWFGHQVDEGSFRGGCSYVLCWFGYEVGLAAVRIWITHVG